MILLAGFLGHLQDLLNEFKDVKEGFAFGLKRFKTKSNDEGTILIRVSPYDVTSDLNSIQLR